LGINVDFKDGFYRIEKARIERAFFGPGAKAPFLYQESHLSAAFRLRQSEG
jgi:hypothetical protein